MIIIDVDGEIAKYLDRPEFDSISCIKLDQISFELSGYVTDELTIVHEDILNSKSMKILNKLEELSMFIVFSKNLMGSQLNSFSFSNMVDVIGADTNLFLLKNKLTLFSELLKERDILRSQLFSINKELTQTMGNVEAELLKVKKVYKLKTPRRFQDIKGIQASSKYSAGESIGGEFFDIFVNQNKVFVMMSATSSYLASSSILQFFSNLKDENEINESIEKEFIENIRHDVEKINENKKKEVEIHLYTAIIDLNSLKISGHCFGHFSFMSSLAKKSIFSNAKLLRSEFKKARFESFLERGERIFLSSPGFIKNWQALNPEFLIEELVMNEKIKSIDILDEIFFQLKKDSLSGFLPNDASAIILEVQKNAMVQV